MPSRRAAGAGLVLIPSVFTGPGPFTRVTPSEPPQLAYPARGTGALWQPRGAATGSRALAAVLGRSRTLLLTELASPASTTGLALRTGLSTAGVSQHLTALRDAGLVSAHRAGRSVLHARTSVAESLLATSREVDPRGAR
ncbi:ArsR family transcriptional regulator [Streptomyces sp. QHH-9511]|nr:ArsR family transcriptional regulator [Streptomyces sp. QHH-9511]